MPAPKPVYQAIASAVQARANCAKGAEHVSAIPAPNRTREQTARIANHSAWFAKHTEHAEYLTRAFLPSGSGFDNGATLDWERTTPERLVFTTAFHHMSEHGFYTRWTDHAVTVRPSLVSGFDLSVSGRNYRDIKEYIGETFSHALGAQVETVHTCGEWIYQLVAEPPAPGGAL